MKNKYKFEKYNLKSRNKKTINFSIEDTSENRTALCLWYDFIKEVWWIGGSWNWNKERSILKGKVHNFIKSRKFTKVPLKKKFFRLENFIKNQIFQLNRDLILEGKED